ncbi:hypothetical protein LshimejAT787_0604800 [Lyophyllum shimeji]|uniref:Uncharacterized protein n=1 Tax=Lyophyllum shimeji TaxID=47721 RepID=A0A9P3PPQ7_LYOSH|nr:hypothetical protein LshimejAT787_0604800 [Lyophyllum shimeji]
MSAPTSIPTEIVVPIIEGYTQGIRPAFPFILISAVFSAMLIPLLVMLFVLSTSRTRQKPIFILNVIAICLGIVVGALCGHLTIQSILSPFTGINATEDLVYNILYIWMPWITEAVLLVRVIVVFAPNLRRSQMAALLAFPVTIKAARAAINIIFLVEWHRKTATGAVNQFSTTQSLADSWLVKASWVLELVDNAYISFLFLWRLGTQGHLFDESKAERVNSSNSKASFPDKLKSLFWIASTNFIFPLIFGLCQIILLFVRGHILVAASVEMANIYISIISTVFATIWSSTLSFKEATATPYSSENKESDVIEPIRFRRGKVPLGWASSGTATSHETASPVELENVKSKNWGGDLT